MVTFERPKANLGTEGDVLLERVVAFAVDTIGFWIVFGGLANLVYLASEILGILINVLAVPLYFGYFVYFEAEYGQTIGKMLTNVVVVTESGNPISYRASAIRALLRIVDWFPYPLHLVGFIAILLTDRSQRLGDVVAETVVVGTRQKGDKL